MIAKIPTHVYDQIILWGFHIFGLNIWVSKTANLPGGKMACTIDVREKNASVSFCKDANTPAILLAQYFSEKYVRDFNDVVQYLRPEEVYQWNLLRNSNAQSGDPHPNTSAFDQVQKLIVERATQPQPDQRDVA